MTARLEGILHQVPFDDLKAGLGEEICDIVEFITGDLTKNALIRAVSRAYGKEVLEKKALRTLMLKCLDPSKIKELASNVGIKDSKFSLVDTIITIGEKAFGHNENTLLILQSLGLGKEELPDAISESPGNIISLSPKEDFHELLDYQNDIRLRVLRYFEEIPGGRALIHIPTGAGKTKTAMHILKDFWYAQQRENTYVLWLAHSQELLEQAIATFQKVWEVLGRDKVSYIRLWGSYPLPVKFNGNAFVFAGVQKLISLKNSNKKDNIAFLESFRDRVGIIVLDEAHKAPAIETYDLLRYLLKTEERQNRYLLGLTATPGRTADSENDRLINLFENLKYSVDLELLSNYMPEKDKEQSFTSVIQYLQHRQILARFKKREIDIPSSELGLDLTQQRKISSLLKKNTDRELPADILEKLVKSRERNYKIIDAIRKAYFEEELTILVFACNIVHAKMLAFAMTLEDIPNGLVLGTTNANRRKELIDRYKDKNDHLRVLINVDVLTTGFDAPNTNCLVVARPVHSVILYSQMLGRGLRGKKMGGAGKCVLIQVIDRIDLGDEKWAFEYFSDYWS